MLRVDSRGVRRSHSPAAVDLNLAAALRDQGGTGQGHGGSGLRFYERDYIEDCLNDTHPVVEVEGAERRGLSLLDVVRRYADAMLQHGRDTDGPQKTGMLLSALDRKTLAPLDTRPPAPAGVAEDRRPGGAGGPLVGANAQQDQNLLRLLYFLEGLSGEARYPEAADTELKWLLAGGQSPQTGLLAWGEHLAWDTRADRVASAGPQPLHAFSRPWMLWPRCFELAPEASRRFVWALWEHHVADHHSGAIRRTARFDGRPQTPAEPSPRQAGFFLRTWAEAFAHTRDDVFLTAIDTVLARYEAEPSGLARPGGRGSGPIEVRDWLSLAIDGDGAARQDAGFLRLPHKLQEKKAFVKTYDPAGSHTSYTPLWDPAEGTPTTAAIGVLCRSRYENTGRIGYRQLIVAAADAYQDSLPGEDVDAWPLTFGQAITLQLGAWRITARRKYHQRAFQLGEIAIAKFFTDSPLPRASLKTDHYETTTGADTLALALAELHLSTRTITIVRTPPNTIDR